MNNNFFKKIFNCFMTLFILTNILTTIAYADSSERSIVGDFFNKVFEIKLSNGRNIFDSDQDAKEREEINDKILEGNKDKFYSLYDRFGGSVQFVPYFGETKISTSLLDKFYTKFIENSSSFSLSAEDIQSLFEAPAISNNAIYNGRPNILSSESIEAGMVDPRVSAYSGISSIGGEASLGNLSLGISNVITNIVSFLSGGKLFKLMNDIFVSICDSGLTNILQAITLFILPIALCIFAFYICKNTIKVIKGNFSFKKFLTRTISCLLSLGLIFALMYNPTLISTFLVDVTSIIDDTLDVVLSTTSDEVVKSDNINNVRSATLWRSTVLEPWCEGTFGEKYEKLYTQYDKEDGHIKMDQSHDDIVNIWSDGSIRYNSAKLTGDIVVPLGNGSTRNWAALAWSCQSIYHIDAINNGSSAGVNRIESETWPKATVTPMNSQIYIDNFRWIDAKLNISPEYKAPDSVVMSYSNSNNYTQNFVGAGCSALWRAILLLPIGILSIRKLKVSFVIIFSSIRLIYHSILGFVIPDDYDFLSNIKKLGSKFYDYLWWCIAVFVSISLYTACIGKGIMIDLIWIILGFYLNKFKPIKTSRQIEQIKFKAKNTVAKIKNKFSKAK